MLNIVVELYVELYVVIQIEKMKFVENERDLLEQADNVAIFGEYLAWLQRCDECIKQLEEPAVPSVLGCRLEIDNLWWSRSRDSRVQRLDYKNVSEVIIRVLAAAAVTRRDSFNERSISRSKIVY